MTPPISDKVLKAAVDAVRKHGTTHFAGKALGISASTLQYRLRKAAERGLLDGDEAPAEDHRIMVPQLLDPELPIEEVVEHLTDKARRRFAAAEERRWIKLPVPTPGPFGIAFIGDPHVDDDGCNWPLLRRHVEVIQKTKALYCAGMGDYQNNWVGRLARLYGNQDASHGTAWRLVEWLIGELSPKLILLIKGNHDMWSGAGDPLNFLKTPGSLSADWSAQLRFALANKTDFKVYAAHHFKGTSIYNDLHGNQRKQKFNGEADLYISGHLHTWGVNHGEDPEKRKVYWLARARGYKHHDTHAMVNGFEEFRHGATITAIVDPDDANPVTRVHCFADLEEAADFLNWKRKRAK